VKNILIVGCGDIGERVAGLCGKKAWSVTGLVRSSASIIRLKQAGVDAYQMDLDRKKNRPALPLKKSVVLYLAPPPNEGDTDPLIRQFLAAIASNALPEKIVLLSTTAVYGNCQGDWITEAHKANPQTSRGLRRLDAEQAVQKWSERTGVPMVLLRVGGIYGAGRLPIESIKKGTPILHEADSPFTNRIHQDDLAQVCIAAIERGRVGEVYNISDGQPSTMSRYFKDIAQVFDLPQPPEVSLEEAEKVMSAGMLSYLKESRRIDNGKMLEELGVVLRYADLAAGLGENESTALKNGR